MHLAQYLFLCFDKTEGLSPGIGKIICFLKSSVSVLWNANALGVGLEFFYNGIYHWNFSVIFSNVKVNE